MEFTRIMTDMKTAGRVAWLVYTLCSVIMEALALINGWPIWIAIGLIISTAVLTVLTFHPKAPERLQSLSLMIFSFANILACTLAEGTFYPATSLFLGATVLLVIYRNERLMLAFTGLTVGTVLLHACVLRTIDLDTPMSIVLFISRISIMLMAQLFLIVVVRGANANQEKMRKSVEDAQRAERYQSDFLANISHEIRTPLNAIIGMCELILRENSLSDSVRENCYNIQASGKSLLTIINDVLDFSKIESGHMELINLEFNIASILNDVINMSEARRQAKDIEILVDADPDIPRGLIGDEVRIRQVMTNLMTNAIKFTEKGSVTLSVSHTQQDYGVNLVVSVLDTGIGITEENIEKLFTSFRRVDTRKNRAVEGTGLGLAICKRLVKQMGGFISVSSKYGAGSEFRFVIPLKVADSRPFASVRSPERIYVAACFGEQASAEGQERIFCETSQRLGIRYRCAGDIESLKALTASEDFTHVFVSSGEYLRDSDFFARTADRLRVFVIQNRIDALVLPAGVKAIFRPFYVIPAVSALNNESLVVNLNERRGADIRFTAPKAKILIVDDNAVNLKVATGLMQPYHMQIMTAQSGAEAIAMLRSRDIDVVFMDHMMPGMDGVEATQIIRGMEGVYRTLPIIALSANAVNGAREMYLNAGFNDFLAKPIELSTLDRILRSYLPREYLEAPPTTDRRSWGRRKSDRPASEQAAILDLNRGVSYSGGNQETYRETLALFLQKSEETIWQLDQLFAQQDGKNYTIMVHALKSTSLSIGAVGLSELSRELEALGKAGDLGSAGKQHAEMLRRYREVAGAIRQHLSETGSIQTPPEETNLTLSEMPIAELRQSIEKARSACRRFDGDAVASIAADTSAFSFGGEPLRDYFGRAAQMAADFEYEAAERILTVLEAKVESTNPT